MPKPKPKSTRVEIIRRDPLRLTIDEWRSDQNLCHEAERALASPVVRQMVDACRASSLANWAVPIDMPIDQRGIHQAKCEGYVMALNDFEDLAKFNKPPDQLVETFAPENRFDHNQQLD